MFFKTATAVVSFQKLQPRLWVKSTSATAAIKKRQFDSSPLY